MGIRTRITSTVQIKRNSTKRYDYRLNDAGELERVEVQDERPKSNMSDTVWDFDSINDDYYNAWKEFEAAKADIQKKHGLESIDITALGVGVVVDSGKNQYRHEVSKEWCSPPCKEFREKGTCKHIQAMEEHNKAMAKVMGKVSRAGEQDDPDTATNRFDANYSNPSVLILMVEDEDKLNEALKNEDKYSIVMLAKDADGHPAIWARSADAVENEDGTCDDEFVLTELDPVFAEKIKNNDIIGPEEGYAVYIREVPLEDGKNHTVVTLAEFDQHHRQLAEIQEAIISRIESGGKTGRIAPEEGINSDVAELAAIAAKWPQLPEEYHDFVAFGRQNLTKEDIMELSPEDQDKYRKAREIASKVPVALDRTFSISGWRQALEQFSEYYTDRKVGEDILSVDLFGPYGSGKTYFAEVVAELTGQPFYKIEASRDLDMQSQLVVTTKKWNPETGSTELVAQKAGLAQALEMVQGSVVLLDESVQMNTADQRLLNSIVQNAKYTATMSAEDGFTTHKVNRKTILFTAHNTDMAGEGVAADNDPSLSSRQATAIEFPAAPKEVKALQMVRYAANMTGEKPVDPRKAMLMVEFLDKLRPLYSGEGAERLFRMPPNDPRDEKRIGVILARYCHDGASEEDLRKAARLILRTVVNKYTDKSDEEGLAKSREAVLDVFSTVMNNSTFPYQWPKMGEAVEAGIKWSDSDDSTLDEFDFI